jgi:hypothetical protein
MALYVALCYYDREQSWEDVPDPESSPEYTEFARRATEAGVMRGGEALHRVTMSTTITVSGGKGGDVLVTDGPYAEAKEVLAGYFLCRLGRTSDAVAELHAAVTLAPSEVEQRLLQDRLRQVRSEPG